MDIARRLHHDKELKAAYTACESVVSAPWWSAVFDESSNFLVYPSWQGIKVVNLIENKVERVLGQVESERFTRVAMYQGVPKGRKKARSDFGMGKAVSKAEVSDPTIIATGLGRSRFYLFSNREPEDTDDPTQVRQCRGSYTSVV